ncbi:MAG: hypothetical protein QG673_31, partial [Pseudomonadota bacterium]|nr:hypothetical protein [Pseudomonadota bacterium]
MIGVGKLNASNTSNATTSASGNQNNNLGSTNPFASESTNISNLFPREASTNPSSLFPREASTNTSNLFPQAASTNTSNLFPLTEKQVLEQTSDKSSESSVVGSSQSCTSDKSEIITKLNEWKNGEIRLFNVVYTLLETCIKPWVDINPWEDLSATDMTESIKSYVDGYLISVEGSNNLHDMAKLGSIIKEFVAVYNQNNKLRATRKEMLIAIQRSICILGKSVLMVDPVTNLMYRGELPFENANLCGAQQIADVIEEYVVNGVEKGSLDLGGLAPGTLLISLPIDVLRILPNLRKLYLPRLNHTFNCPSGMFESGFAKLEFLSIVSEYQLHENIFANGLTNLKQLHLANDGGVYEGGMLHTEFNPNMFNNLGELQVLHIQLEQPDRFTCLKTYLNFSRLSKLETLVFVVESFHKTHNCEISFNQIPSTGALENLTLGGSDNLVDIPSAEDIEEKKWYKNLQTITIEGFGLKNIHTTTIHELKHSFVGVEVRIVKELDSSD